MAFGTCSPWSRWESLQARTSCRTRRPDEPRTWSLTTTPSTPTATWVKLEWTCRQYLSDRPWLANQHAQTRHHFFDFHYYSTIGKVFPFGQLSLIGRAMFIVHETERDRETGRETETDRQTETEKDRERQNWEKERERDVERETETETEKERQRERKSARETERVTQRERERERKNERDKERDRQTDRDVPNTWSSPHVCRTLCQWAGHSVSWRQPIYVSTIMVAEQQRLFVSPDVCRLCLAFDRIFWWFLVLVRVSPCF